MIIHNARGQQGNRQGQLVTREKNLTVPARDQYGHKLYSVNGRGSNPVTGLNNEIVYTDGIERFKGTAKACIDYCKSHYDKKYVIAALFKH